MSGIDQLSQDFHRMEFACRCGCGLNTVDYMLVIVLQDLRNHFEKPVHILSGSRCEKHNLKVGGVENSFHLIGQAADAVIKGVSIDDVAKYLDEKYPEHLGIGWYPGWTHIDARSNRARWGGE